MIATVQAEAPHTLYEQTVRNRLQAILSDNAEWLQTLRQKALLRFQTLGFPTRHLEAWKYINIRPLLGQAFLPYTDAVSLTAADIKPFILGEALIQDSEAVPAPQTLTVQDVLRLVFVNGRYAQALSSVLPVENGIRLDSLKSVLEREPALVQPYLAPDLDTNADAFAVLNTALFEDGLFLHVPDDVTLAPLVHVLFLSTGNSAPRAAYPRNIVVLGRNAKANVLIEHHALTQNAYLNNSVNLFHLAEQAQVEATMVLCESENAWHLASTQSNLAESSHLKLSTVTLSAGVARHSIRTLLQGEHADVTLNGLDVLRGKTEMYHHTVTEHWTPNGKSNQFYKGILDDAVKSEFNGMVFVAHGANGTDSQQLNKNLLLSDDARVWTRPQLQINADDVKCAHGATVGQLEKDQLFYLASRGLDRDLAQSLLTYGFAEDILARLENRWVRQALEHRVLDNLQGLNAGLRRQLGAE